MEKIKDFLLGCLLVFLAFLWTVMWLAIDIIILPLILAIWLMAFIDRKKNPEEYQRVCFDLEELFALTFFLFIGG